MFIRPAHGARRACLLHGRLAANNGVAASLATSVYREITGTLFPAAITVSRSRMVGFAHTHPIDGNFRPSDPYDILMRDIGARFGIHAFPIYTYRAPFPGNDRLVMQNWNW